MGDRAAFNQALEHSLVEMGFAEDAVRQAIATCDGNAAAALDSLLMQAAANGNNAPSVASMANSLANDDDDYALLTTDDDDALLAADDAAADAPPFVPPASAPIGAPNALASRQTYHPAQHPLSAVGQAPVKERRAASAMPLTAASLQREQSQQPQQRAPVQYERFSPSTISTPAPAANGAPAGGSIIYSKLPDFAALSANGIGTGANGSPANAKRPVVAATSATGSDDDDPQRAASLTQLLQLTEAAPEQSASRQIADQLRSLLYTTDGKRKAVARKPNALPAPRAKTGAAAPSSSSTQPKPAAAAASSSASAQPSKPHGAFHELSNSSPMHLIHFAMLQEGNGVPLGVNAHGGRKYSKSFIGTDAFDWILDCCRNVSRDRAIEICQKLVRGRFLLQIDYKAELRPFSLTEVYRLNPKSKLLLPGVQPPIVLLAKDNMTPEKYAMMNVPAAHLIATLPVQQAPAAAMSTPATAPAKVARQEPAQPAAQPAASNTVARAASTGNNAPTAAPVAAQPRQGSMSGIASLVNAPPQRGSFGPTLSRGSDRRDDRTPDAAAAAPSNGAKASAPAAAAQQPAAAATSTAAGGATSPVNVAPQQRSAYDQLPTKPRTIYDQAPEAPPASNALGAIPSSLHTSATAPPASSDASFDEEFASFIYFDWYHQRISKTAAEERVGSIPGNFLLRDSSKPGCLCITYVSQKRGVSHVLVEKANGRWTMKGATTDWASVPDLLLTYAKVYQQAVVPPGGPIGGKPRNGAGRP